MTIGNASNFEIGHVFSNSGCALRVPGGREGLRPMLIDCSHLTRMDARRRWADTSEGPHTKAGRTEEKEKREGS